MRVRCGPVAQFRAKITHRCLRRVKEDDIVREDIKYPYTSCYIVESVLDSLAVPKVPSYYKHDLVLFVYLQDMDFIPESKLESLDDMSRQVKVIGTTVEFKSTARNFLRVRLLISDMLVHISRDNCYISCM